MTDLLNEIKKIELNEKREIKGVKKIIGDILYIRSKVKHIMYQYDLIENDSLPYNYAYYSPNSNDDLLEAFTIFKKYNILFPIMNKSNDLIATIKTVMINDKLDYCDKNTLEYYIAILFMINDSLNNLLNEIK